MAFGDRKSERVDFERGIHVYIMGIDGTWRRDCMMVDVSQTGARLRVEGSLEGLDLKEFFLLLSSTGLAYRRCKLVRVPCQKNSTARSHAGNAQEDQGGTATAHARAYPRARGLAQAGGQRLLRLS